MRNWVQDLADLTSTSEPAVLLTIATVRGSAPREVGARMIITAHETIGTIGGGQLEYQCVKIAAAQLREGGEIENEIGARRFALGANCGQCCGGVVEVLFETLVDVNSAWMPSLVASYQRREAVVLITGLTKPHRRFLLSDTSCHSYDDSEPCSSSILKTAKNLLTSNDNAKVVDNYLFEPVRESDFNVAIFGAGHVGAATVDALSRLDCKIRWIDGRRNIFPTTVPANVTCVESADPAREVAALPAGSFFLIMTHSHPLDQEICQQALNRGDFAYCGLIGSASKRRRFERLMLKQGLNEDLLSRLVCPIGIAGIQGKKPVEIAVSVAAEVLQIRDASVKSRNEPILREVRS